MENGNNIQLEIRPEYWNSGIRFLYEKGYLETGQDVIPNDIFLEIVSFNNSYLPYARLNKNNKLLFSQELYVLDIKGYELKEKVEDFLKSEVLYFSEGLLEYLHSPPIKEAYKSVKLNWILRFKKKILLQ